jgi:4-carboxymuconolactone decarboxylase
MRLSKARLEPLPEGSMTSEQLALIKPLNERYGFVFNILKTLMHNMPLLKAWNPLAGHIMATSSLAPRLREIAIMRVGWTTKCEYEWGQHVLMSEPAGLTNEDHLRIIEGADAEGWNAAERLIISATDELLKDTIISEATWSGLKQQFSDQQILDVIFTIGQYNMLAMALNSLGVQRETNVPGFP